MGRRKFVLVTMLALMSAMAGAVGTLQIGEATVEDDKVIIPVILGGEVGDGVAALDFRLNYDAEALRPISALPGSAALGADKRVMGNSIKPGEYIVVMMEMNQTTCGLGEVARIVMQRTSDSQDGDWGLGITRPTLASLEGTVIRSRVIPYGNSPQNDGAVAEGDDNTRKTTDGTDDVGPTLGPDEPLSARNRSTPAGSEVGFLRPDGEGGVSGAEAPRNASESASVRLLTAANAADRIRAEIHTPGSPPVEKTVSGAPAARGKNGSGLLHFGAEDDNISNQHSASPLVKMAKAARGAPAVVKTIEDTTRASAVGKGGSKQGVPGSPRSGNRFIVPAVTCGILVGLVGLLLLRRKLFD